jgi:8-oxo-dGTP pyrophosphatase MutT (NUDIX family)
VIAYRIQDGKVRVLLMTSRDTGRWIIPRGNIKPGVTPCRAAEQEAYEEAGVRGTIIGSDPLGMYIYSKKLASGEARTATVEVYLLRVSTSSWWISAVGEVASTRGLRADWSAAGESETNCSVICRFGVNSASAA